jgi:hypothetical protein
MTLDNRKKLAEMLITSTERDKLEYFIAACTAIQEQSVNPLLAFHERIARIEDEWKTSHPYGTREDFSEWYEREGYRR